MVAITGERCWERTGGREVVGGEVYLEEVEEIIGVEVIMVGAAIALKRQESILDWVEMNTQSGRAIVTGKPLY